MIKRTFLHILLGASFAVSPALLKAQQYPAKPVTLIVPFSAGSATDQLARVLGKELQETLGQPFVVDNRAGAQGTIAAEYVSRAAPDGYTILMTTNTTQAANASLFKKLAYDPIKDFQPIVRLATTPLMLMVRSDFPAKNVSEFLAYGRAHSGKISGGYGSSGSQVNIAMISTMGKFSVMPVPYKGIPQVLTDLTGGTIDFAFVDLTNAISQAKGGRLKGLGVTSETRTPLLPDMPAVAEALPGFELTGWFALMAPAGTSRDVVSKIYDATTKALAKKSSVDKFSALGFDIAPMNAAQLDGFIRSEIEKWSRYVKAAGIEPQ
ncbi:MAG: tripartite tricarboxylate transporter substrate binding protein [Ottowia sp.]|uniref:Bug family tripartite tricarboxylate transporter substrate binding protein n=1 Tax=Ottowia sp. TaxID=1898956 RepID=UPI003C773DEA